MYLALRVHGVHVPTGLDIAHEPVPLGRVLHVVQLVADPTGVDPPQPLHGVPRGPAQLLQAHGRGRDRIEVRPCDAVVFRLDRWVPGSRGAQRVDRNVEVSQRTQGLDQRARGSGDSELFRGGRSRFRPDPRSYGVAPVNQIDQRRRDHAPVPEGLLIQFLRQAGVVSIRGGIAPRPPVFAQVTVQPVGLRVRADLVPAPAPGRFKLSDA